MFKFGLCQLVEVNATGAIAVVKGREDEVNCENCYLVSFLAKENKEPNKDVSDDEDRGYSRFAESQLSVVEDEHYPGTPIFMVNDDPHNPPEEECKRVN
ncbi:hypothetical protein HV353_21690 (plasmid) [Enterobacter roggenkampii]|uniref:hypothetical protein n=1 Tax=Enterobacter roggenkampii TaxID=1812935 RepID=UPI0015FA57B3|nr:hypothetical protein [Enterobacter roggenkampii]MBA7745165.1 hypothetical protein [Enterobacter roggenkampii]